MAAARPSVQIVEALELMDTFRNGFIPDSKAPPFTQATYKAWREAGGLNRREVAMRIRDIRAAVVSAAMVYVPQTAEQ